MDMPRFEGEMKQLNAADTIVLLTAFNYDLQFDPNTQVVAIGVQMSSGHTRYQMMFGRLEFGKFIKQLSDAWERMKDNTDEPSPIVH